MQIDFLFAIAVLIMSVVLHEVSHGYVAYILGDPTAKYAGRLTLNPLKHLDIFGSIILPIFTYLAGGFIIGWAKPVPFNPYNLKNKKWGPAIVGIAGPLTNFLVLLVFGLALRFGGNISFLPASFFQIAATVALINATLMILNLIPIPPLDGSRVLQALLPYRWQNIQHVLERYSFFFVIIFIFFIWPYLFLPIVGNLFKLITGLGF
jgi:Zn-dependent protease